MSVGVARLAPKILQDGAVLLARSVTYAFASFGVAGHGGASAAINAKPDARDEAVKAFADEVGPLAESGRLVLAPALGVSPDELSPLGWTEPDSALLAAGALAAARVAGPLDWRTAAVVGAGAGGGAPPRPPPPGRGPGAPPPLPPPGGGLFVPRQAGGGA